MEHNDTVIVLLAPADGALLTAPVDSAAAELATSLPAGSRVRVAHLLDDPYPLGGEWTGVIELHGDAAAIAKALDGLADRLGSSIDAERSAVVVGRDRVIFERAIPDGVRPVKMYYALFAYDNRPFDRAEFSRQWTEGHAPLVEHSPYQLTYYQLHADPEATAAASAAAGFGIGNIAGVAHEEFPAKDALAAAAVDPDLADERGDLAIFADRDRSRGMLSHTTVLRG
ncbi:MAG TPA: EthD domain-containing protein [Ilumatobacteraceae bacterium]|jgi:hypothetical protein